MAEPATDQAADNEVTRQPTSEKQHSPFEQALSRLAEISYSDGRPLNVLAEFATVIKHTLSVDVVTVLEAVADQDVLVIQAAVGIDASIIGQPAAKRDLESMSGYTLLRQTTVVLEDIDHPERPYEISQIKRDAGVKSGVTVPVPPEKALYGVLGVFCKYPRIYTDDEILFLSRSALYLAGIMIRHKEVTSRKKAQQWLRVMEEATLRSVSATSQPALLSSFAKLLSGGPDSISDLSFIDIETDSGEIFRGAAAKHGVSLQALPGTKPLLYPPDPGSPYGTPAVLDSGQPHTITPVADEHLRSLARDENHLETFRSLNIVSYMCLPIKLHRRTLGALVLISCDKPYTREDERRAGRLAYLIGIAIEGIQSRIHRLGELRGHVETFFNTPEPQAPDPREDTRKGTTGDTRGDTTHLEPYSPGSSDHLPDPNLGEHRTMDECEECLETQLTEREVEVVQLLSEGKNQGAVSSKLGFGKWTYYSHIRNIRAKLELTSATPMSTLLSAARDRDYI